VFVTTNPIWIALASWLLLREHIGPRTIGGIGLSLCGGVLIFMSSSGQGTMAPYENMLLGNTLALLGAITVSGYFLIGRGLRRRLSTLAYIWLAYTTGAGILVLLVLLSGQQVLSFSPLTYLVLLALAVGPQLMGHTAFNWALAHLSATFIALAILGEPIFSAIWAWVLFDERIDISRPDGMMQVAGFLLLLGGIYVAALGERPAKAEVANAL
jgi:drug/metabolite transporter (DMT)-like permease